jgi:glycosyltransferase involved in cell wall biosynthesis
MKICLVSSDYFPNIGGVATHVYSLAHALSLAGLSVSVATTTAADESSVAPKDEKNCFAVVRVVPRVSRFRWLNVIYRNFAMAKAISNARKDAGGIDIIHQHDYKTSSLAISVMRRKSLWVWTNHSSGFLKDAGSFLGSVLARIAQGRVSSIITVSEEILESSERLWPNKSVTFISNGVDTSRFVVNKTTKACERKAIDFLCPRRIVEKNGVYVWAQAVKQMLKMDVFRQTTFSFTGNSVSENTSSAEIKKVLELLGPESVTGQVLFLGNIKPNIMPEVVAATDIVVIPSFVEAISISALEGMSCGKPIIASDVGGLPFIVKDGVTGLLVPSGDVGALVAAATKLLLNGSLREELGLNARAFVEGQFSWKKVATETLRFYKESSSAL